MRRTLLFVASFACALAKISPADVSTWGSDDIADFFHKKGGVAVEAAKIEAAGIQGDDLFDGLINEKVLEDLGVSSAFNQNKILKALAALDKDATEKPDSVWEWRVANLRLCDFWLLPLYGTSPGLLMIWSRYFDTSEGVLDALDDVVDECSTLWFWTMFFFLPSYPFYTIVSASPIGGFAGMIIYLVALSRLVIDFGSLFKFFTAFPGRMKKELGGLIPAFVGYYLMYWIMPKFILDLIMYVWIYIGYPVLTVIGFASLGILFLAAAAN